MKLPALRDLLSRKGYIVRLGVVVLLISILPLGVLTVVAGQNNRRLMESQVLETSRNYLAQTVNAAEMVVSQIDQTFFSLGSTEEMTQFTTFLYGSYYEKLSGAIKESDAVQLYEYLNRKKAVIRYLGVLQSSNQAFHSVFFIDRSKNLVLTSIGPQYTVEEFEKLELLGEGYESREGFYINSSVRKISSRFAEEARVISLIFPTGSVYNQNFIIVNIDVDRLYNGLLKNLSSKLVSELIIVAEDGQRLYDQSSPLAKEFLKSPELFSSAEPGRVTSVNGRRVLVARQKSDRFGWNFYSIISLDEVYKTIGFNNSVLFFSTAILLVLALSFGFMEVRNFYKPVNRLVELVRQRSRQPQTQENEMAVIEGALRRSMLSREIAREGLGERLYSYQEQFLRMLLDGGLDENAVLEGFEYFALPISPFNLRPLMFRVEPLEAGKKAEPGHSACLEIKERLQGLAQTHRCVALSLSGGGYLLLVNQDGADEERMEVLAAGIRQEVAVGFGVRCVAGIGRRAASTNELPAVVTELRTAYRSRNPHTGPDIFHSGDPSGEAAGSFVFFREHEKQLLEQIRGGSREDARQSMAYVLERVLEGGRGLSPRVLQYSMAKILTDLIVCSNELGLDLERAAEAGTCLYEQLLQLREPGDYSPWFMRLLDVLFDSIPRESSAFQNEHVRAVQRLIRSEAGRELTLTSAAEVLGLNPSYLSRVLKEKTGRTFMDFITEARIESSREMLLNTDLKVEEISDKIGYSNANYFIKIFRRHNGVTPGEYRKLNRQPRRP